MTRDDARRLAEAISRLPTKRVSRMNDDGPMVCKKCLVAAVGKVLQASDGWFDGEKWKEACE